MSFTKKALATAPYGTDNRRKENVEYWIQNWEVNQSDQREIYIVQGQVVKRSIKLIQSWFYWKLELQFI